LPAQSEPGAAARQYTALLLALRAQARGAAALAAAAEAARAGVALPPLAHFAVLSALTRAGDASGLWSEARVSQSLTWAEVAQSYHAEGTAIGSGSGRDAQPTSRGRRWRTAFVLVSASTRGFAAK